MFMKDPGRGGREKNAPYKTQHYRIPMPIKTTVVHLATAYRSLIGGTDDPLGEGLLERVRSVIASSMSESLKDGTKLETFYKDGTKLLVDEDEEDKNDEVDEGEDNSIPALNETIKRQAENTAKLITEVKMLERELQASQEEVKKLTTERERAINILIPSLSYAAQAGRKIQSAIREAFPNISG